MTSAVSAVAAVPRVRARLIAQQRDIIANAAGIVAEGRDIGTVVAPDAPVKVFLTADSTARADRRAARDQLVRRPQPRSSRTAAIAWTPRRAARPKTRWRSIPPSWTWTR